MLHSQDVTIDVFVKCSRADAYVLLDLYPADQPHAVLSAPLADVMSSKVSAAVSGPAARVLTSVVSQPPSRGRWSYLVKFC